VASRCRAACRSPITTPAHGTAYDIVGQGKANAEAMTQAYLLAAKMGASRLT
jgi:4-hydroxythreonine-4-phosphate dehydrogenase